MRRKLIWLLVVSTVIRGRSRVRREHPGYAGVGILGHHDLPWAASADFDASHHLCRLLRPMALRKRFKNLWLSFQKTKGPSDLYVQSNVWEVGGYHRLAHSPGSQPGHRHRRHRDQPMTETIRPAPPQGVHHRHEPSSMRAETMPT